jgi:hypothetical protein
VAFNRAVFTMESNFSFLANRVTSSPATEPNPAPGAGQHHTARGDFAEVLNGQSLKAQRQHLAALDTPGQGLQVRPLGNKLNIITSDAPLPDLDSLAQFARLQGLDESAVQALFGTPTATPSASLAAGTATTEALTQQTLLDGMGLEASKTAELTAAALGSLMLGQEATKTAQDLSATLAAASAAGVMSASLTLERKAQATLKSDSLEASALDLNAVQAAPTGLQIQPDPLGTALLTPPPLPMSAAPLAAMPLAVTAPLAVVPMAVSAPLAVAAPQGVAGGTSGTALLGVQSAAVSLMPMTVQAWAGTAPVTAVDGEPPVAPPMGPQDAVRLTLAMPAPEITKQLAQMSGTGKETTWAALLASGPAAKDLPSAIETVALELPAGYDADLLVDLTDANPSQPNDLSTQAGTAGPQSITTHANASAGGNSADTAQAQADHRAQQFQQIAEKMGQAAAQRLIAQIERGQWKMQMRMQPAALGNINVELDMHAGGLDALFSADNAVTRELMTQGSTKLRDTLTQAGMTVASVSVNGEQSRQSGGNSTPGKGRNLPAGTRSVNGLASAAAVAPSSAPATATDGLNVLA